MCGAAIGIAGRPVCFGDVAGRACISPATSKDATAFYDAREVTAEATWDIVWSAAGHAFAEILLSPRDIIVGRSDQFKKQSGSRIKGTNPGEKPDYSRLISVSEAGTRVALIDRGRDPVVRAYSLADHKPFLSRIEGSVAVAPDGSWMALARRPVSDKQTWAVDVIPIDLAFKSGFPSRVRMSIPIEEPSTQIAQLYAAQSARSLCKPPMSITPPWGTPSSLMPLRESRVSNPSTARPRYSGPHGSCS